MTRPCPQCRKPPTRTSILNACFYVYCSDCYDDRGSPIGIDPFSPQGAITDWNACVEFHTQGVDL